MASLNVHNYSNFLCFVVIVTILTYLIPPIGLLNGDEEMYFKTAYDYFNDNYNQNSAFILNKNSLNHRFLFDFLCGTLINYVGYEYTNIIGRIFVILFFSYSLTSLFKILNLGIIAITLILISFLIFNQTYYSELQLFKGFLASDISFSISILSIVYTFKKKNLIALISLVFATYFHFLIGGYFFLFFIFYFFISSENKILASAYVFLYLILISPIFFILINTNFQNDIYVSEYDVDWIYSFLRHPHHLLPFKSIETFINDWLPGIILSLFLFLQVVYIHYKKLFINYSFLSLYLIIGNIYLISAFIISYFDFSFTFSKLYLFRPACIVFLLTLVFLVKFYIRKFNLYKILNKYYIVKSFLVFFIISSFLLFTQTSRLNNTSTKIDKIEFIKFVKKNTPESSNFLFESSMLDFERLTGRTSFFSNKLIPTHTSGITTWYERRLLYKQIFDHKKLVKNKSINFFVTKAESKNINFSEIVFKNNDYVLYLNN